MGVNNANYTAQVESDRFQVNNALKLNDNSKIKLGDSNDLQIFHDGSHSYVSDVGTGHLRITGTNVLIEDGAGTDYIYAASDAVTLYNAGNIKLQTTSAGVSVTGNLTASGSLYLTDTNTRLHEGDGNSLRITTNSGYVDIGPMNSSFSHFQTDRNQFYFNKQLNVSGHVLPYLNNTYYSGLSSNRWANVYSVAGDFSGNLTVSGTGTINGVRLGRDWHIANRAGLRLDSNGTSYPADILFGHTSAANQTSWNGVYWAMSSRGANHSPQNAFYFYRGSGHASPNNSEATIMTFTPDLKVGINTTNPQTTFHSAGTIRVGTSTFTDYKASQQYSNGTYEVALASGSFKIADGSNNAKFTITPSTGSASFSNNLTVGGHTTAQSSSTISASSRIDVADTTSGAFRFYSTAAFRGGLGTGRWASGVSGTEVDLALYVNGDNDFDIWTNNVKRATFNSTGVGIGTAQPANKLTVTDGATPYTTANVLLQVKRNASNGNDDTSRASLMLANNSNGFNIAYGGTTDRLRFIDGGNNEIVTFKNGGNIGINSTDPAKLLTVQSTTSPIIGLYSTYSDSNARNWAIATNNSAYGDFTISNSAANGGDPTAIKFRISKEGAVGIGGTPSSKFHVVGTSTVATTKAEMNSKSVMKLHHNNPSTASTNMQFAGVGSGMGFQVTNYNDTANWDIYLNPFGGNVMIGSNATPSAKLHAVSTQCDVLAESTTAGQSTRYRLKTTSREWRIGTFSGQNNNLWFYDASAGAYRLVLDPNGRCMIGGTSPDGTLHVHTASAGTVTADADRDDLVIENSTNVGMTFLSPNTAKQAIAFGDPQNSRVGLITYDHADDSLAVRVNNTDNLIKVISTGVGIQKTPNAQYSLDIYGQMLVGSHMSFKATNSLQGIGFNRNVHNGGIYSSSYHAYQLHSNANNFELQRYNGSGTFLGYGLTCNTSGNIGVNIQSASAKLHVYQGNCSAPTDSNTHVVIEDSDHSYLGIYGGSTSDVGIHFGDSAIDARIKYENDNRKLKFAATGTTDLMTLDSTGVGIGCTPSQKLDVNGQSRLAGKVTAVTSEVAITSGGAYTTHLNYNNTGSHYISTGNSGFTVFRGSSNGVTAMRVNGDGKVSINSGSNNGYNLYVNGTSYFNSGSTQNPATLYTSQSTGGNYLLFNNASGQLGYLGWGSTGNNDLYIVNQGGSNTGSIRLYAGSSTKVLVSSDGDTDITGRLGVGGAHNNSYQLYVTGVGLITSNLRLGGPSSSAAGNANDPAITVGGHTNAGVYFENSGVGLGAGTNKYLFLNSDGDVDIKNKLGVGGAHGSFTFTVNGSSYFDGQSVFDTDTGANPVYITRSGSTSSQFLSFKVEDRVATILHQQDETDGDHLMRFDIEGGGSHPHTQKYFQFNPNDDVNFQMGRCRLGYVGHADYAGFSHYDQASTTNYALLQSSIGDTFVNSASGKSIFFRQNNSDSGIINGSQNWGIGTIYPGSYKLYVNGTTYLGGNSVLGGDLYFGSTSGSFITTSSSNLRLAGDNGVKLQTYSGGWQDRLVIADGGQITFANAYTFPTSIGSAGQVLKVPSSGTTLEWGSGGSSYSLPTASSSTKGGIKIDGSDFTVNSSTAVMTLHSSVTKRYSGYLQMDSSGNEQYTINHGLGTQDVIVQVRRYAGSGSTRAQRFSNDEGTHLDMGVECKVVPCDANGAMSSNYVSLDFSGFNYSNNDYVYYTIIG